jgi:amidase
MSASQKFKIQEATIADIHTAYQSGELTARELVEMYLKRIGA